MGKGTTEATDPATVSPPVGGERRTTVPAWMIAGTVEIVRAPGQLQQQLSIGTRQEEGRAPEIIAIHLSGARPPVGCGGRTNTLAWMKPSAGILVVARRRSPVAVSATVDDPSCVAAPLGPLPNVVPLSVRRSPPLISALALSMLGDLSSCNASS